MKNYIALVSRENCLSIDIQRHIDSMGLGVKTISNFDEINNLLLLTKNYHFRYFVFITELKIDSKWNNLIFETAEEMDVENGADDKKLLIISPYFKRVKDLQKIEIIERNLLKDKRLSLGIIYLGDVVGFNGGNHLYNRMFRYLLGGIVKNRKVKIYSNEKFNLVPSELIAKLIIENLFSMKAYGKRTAILGKDIKLQIIKRIFKKFKIEKNLNIVYEPIYFQPEKEQLIRVSAGQRMLTVSILKTIQKRIKTQIFTSKLNDNNIALEGEFLKNINVIDNNQTSFKKKRYFDIKRVLPKFILAVWIIFLTPFINLLVIFLGIKSSTNLYDRGLIGPSYSLIKNTEKLANANDKYLKYLLERTYIYKFYKPTGGISSMLFYESRIIKNINELTLDLIGVMDKLFFFNNSNSGFDIKLFSQRIDNIYKLSANIEGENKNLPHIFSGLLSNDYQKLAEKLISSKYIIDYLDSILGYDGERRYIIIFQNNYILRPTGGRIENFAELTLDKGRIINYQIYNNSYADLKLIGKVDPPQAIIKYFNIDKWYFRDSNWESDVSDSSIQALWFIKNELKDNFDGVITINYRFLLDINKVFNQKGVNEEMMVNSFKKTGEENYPKDSNNESLEIIKNILSGKNNAKKYIKSLLLKESVNSFEKSDIFLFFNNKDIYSSYLKIYWNKKIGNLCNDSCYVDQLYLSEFSENIDDLVREQSLEISMEGVLIKRKLTLFLRNMSDNNYRSYFRLGINSDSGFSKADIYEKDNKKSISLEISSNNKLKEGGVFLDIPTKSDMILIFNWEGPFDNKNGNRRYNLYINKQPGVKPYPIEIKIKANEYDKLVADKGDVLTERGDFLYNTLLSKNLLMTLVNSEYE